jgi:dolichol-phosphate mannosyltransferase
VLLPTYNEKDTLPLTVQNVLQNSGADICILDDHSPDGTGEIADGLAQANPRVYVVHRPCKQGLGAAYVDGFKRALESQYSFVVHMDADLSHPASVLPTMLKLAQQHDVVLGSRWVKDGGTRRWPWYRKVISKAGSWYARTVLQLPVRDVTGGFKCFNQRALQALPLEHIQTTGYAFQIETTYRLFQLGFSVVETPIVFTEREQGCSKMTWKIILEAVMGVPKLRFSIGRSFQRSTPNFCGHKTNKSPCQSPSK